MNMSKKKAKYLGILVPVALVVVLAGVIVWVYYSFVPQEDLVFYSPDSDLAKNDGTLQYPSPMGSDPGWGEAIFPWHLVDGVRERGSSWTYGLAFTGGEQGYEDTCGWRQATIEFREKESFNRVVIWHMGDNLNIPIYYLRAWNEKAQDWDTLLTSTTMKQRTDVYKRPFPLAVPVEDTFKTTRSTKIQYLFNNCGGSHGWLTEFEVYHDQPGDRPDCLVVNADSHKY